MRRWTGSGKVPQTNQKSFIALPKPSHKKLCKNCLISFLFLILHSAVLAQHTTPPPARFHDIFSDLPIPDAASLSILKKNENPQARVQRFIFIRSVVSNTKCYVGEPVLLTYQLYSALQNESEIYKLPSFAGSSMMELSVVNEHPVYKVLRGQNYRVFNLRQFQIIPLQAGPLIIDTLAVSNTVHYKINPDSTGYYQGIVYADPVTINVKPLPDPGKPVNFSGAVGDFQLMVSVDSPRLAAGEANALHIEISGSGNFIPLSMPEINWPDGFDYFPEREKTTMEKNSFPPVGKETFDIAFVPKKTGKFFIPQLQISFFDALHGLYKMSSSSPIGIVVLPARPSSAVEHEPSNKPSLHNYDIWIPATIILATILGFFIFMWKRKRS
jgi:hypothetical protein